MIINMRAIINNILLPQSYDSYGDIGGLYGNQRAKEFIINNIVISYNNINPSHTSCGTIVGYTFNSNQTISNLIANNSEIHSISISGGLIGYSYNSSMYLSNSIIQSVKIGSQSGVGIVIGFIDGANIISIYNSKSLNNYINNDLQTDCNNLLNTWSVTQCACPPNASIINNNCVP
ncbi:Hypothetical_protein [Hexamita inflata]|uniref:Hypothetical_protein n=1 Tax=Hexamita inflata TaxID=28002 RepID=A0AA86S0D9_9EUKA|nr:Hypothetical protein HINF_LOCUS16338 [Hexamita inflata]CAI9975860.1 Hypothetical protein HINF_LOCUS63505 [Hexamita inflata]CAI9975862.1 Hypothetical protein HINF_LOCUS63507 [Hexamita inflata]